MQGAPADVVTEAIVREVFGIDCRIIQDLVTETLMVVPNSHRRKPTVTEPKFNEVNFQPYHQPAAHLYRHRSHP